MRYNVLGFDQEKVCKLKIDEHGKEKKLDLTDLLILNHIYHFSERKGIKEITLNNKQYYWVEYNTILNELPILNIKKHALRDRIDKMHYLGLIEKILVNDKGYSNMTYFRIGESFESILFKNKQEGDLKQQRGVNLNDRGVSIQLTDMNNNINSNNNKNNNLEDDSYFEECWVTYKRKGSKARAKIQWDNIEAEKKKNILQHIEAYVYVRDLKFQKNFEKYLSDKEYENVVFQNDDILYDPQKELYEYKPICDGITLKKDNYSNRYIYTGYDARNICDGYSSENRPDGARVTLEYDRTEFVWRKENKRWFPI